MRSDDEVRHTLILSVEASSTVMRRVPDVATS